MYFAYSVHKQTAAWWNKSPEAKIHHSIATTAAEGPKSTQRSDRYRSVIKLVHDSQTMLQFFWAGTVRKRDLRCQIADDELCFGNCTSIENYTFTSWIREVMMVKHWSDGFLPEWNISEWLMFKSQAERLS